MTAGLPRSRTGASASTPLPVTNVFLQHRVAEVRIGPGKSFMTPTSKLASGAAARAEAVDQVAPAADADVGPFVLNLCSSTTPMALAKTEQPELKRFSFFVSRRFEEGRERFRLHMGFFATLAEAEEWLGAVRDIYPGAWAGEAPGKKLRERAIAAAAAHARHAPGPPAAAPQASSSARTLTPARAAQAQAPAPVASVENIPSALNVPTLHAAPAAAASVSQADRAGGAMPRAGTVSPATAKGLAHKPGSVSTAVAMHSFVPMTPSAAAATSAPAMRSSRGQPVSENRPGGAPQARTQAPPVPTKGAPPTQKGSVGLRPAATQRPSSRPENSQGTPSSQFGTRVSNAPKGQAPSVAARGSKPKATYPNSNLREVLAALDDATGETRMMPAPGIPDPVVADEATFTDTQVLRLLEARRSDGDERAGSDAVTGAISLLKPDDTGTRRALKEAVTHNSPVSFAVQLQWSVQPVELTKVPPLAIFSAYTLYTVEGSRDGRKWYGLRLGFFSDAISAKQVAYYVRSEFASVAVVPVSPQERERASDSDKKSASSLAFPKKTTRIETTEEFKLLDPDVPLRPLSSQKPQRDTKPAATTASNVPGRGAPGRPLSEPPGARRNPRGGAGRVVRAREQRGPQTLEETLEILGASELSIDSGRETVNDSGVRHLRVEVQKNTPFSRLLERLSERVRKP